MSLLRFQALSIEVVGTLIDAERGMLDFLRRTAPAVRVADEDFLHACRIARASPLAGYFPDDLERVWTEVAHEFRLPRDAAAGFRDSVAQWPAFADAVAALRRLQRHHRLVAATHAQRWALEGFQRTLGVRFDAVVSSDDTEREKPDPRYFAHMKEMLSAHGITQPGTLHIGPSPFDDIRIPHALGWRTCWIERPRAPDRDFRGMTERPTRPDWHFRALRQLADAVDAEAAQRQRMAEATMDESWALA